MPLGKLCSLVEFNFNEKTKVSSIFGPMYQVYIKKGADLKKNKRSFF